MIAAAGSHNLLMLGPPGSGKTMLAKRLPSNLPTLSPEESIETTRIYSSMGRLQAGQPLMAVRHSVLPHHTISNAGLVGGGSPPAPAKSALPTTVCCSSMNSLSLIERRWKSCVSRWKTVS